MFEPDDLLLALTGAQVELIVIGGVAVGVHGFVRATKDLDIVPAPAQENLQRLAHLLSAIHAQHVGLGDFGDRRTFRISSGCLDKADALA